ncbi:MAG: hypothetical protein LBE25_14425 [Arthrobacter sp.]|jgi:hypothetical protein|nr:hypothetical protein [Arthrobacter sp.]
MSERENTAETTPTVEAAEQAAAPREAASAEEVAAWLVERIQRVTPHAFYAKTAVREIEEDFGEDFIVADRNGHASIRPDVLAVFGESKPAEIRWNTRSKSWWLPTPEQLAAFKEADERKAAKKRAHEASRAAAAPAEAKEGKASA